MNLRLLFIMSAVLFALVYVAPVSAAPLSQEIVDTVVVQGKAEFTVRITLEDGTIVEVPMAVDWLAESVGSAGTADAEAGEAAEAALTISPGLVEAGGAVVAVEAVEPITASLAVTLTHTTSSAVSFAVVPTIVAPPVVTSSTELTATGAVTATPGVTNALPVTPEVTTPVSPTVPVVTGPVTNEISNLRGGPGTEFPIVGQAQAGEAVNVVGQNADGTWLVLANGSWIAAFLVENIPAGLPIVVPTATPSPPPATTVLTPTVTPTAPPAPTTP